MSLPPVPRSLCNSFVDLFSPFSILVVFSVFHSCNPIGTGLVAREKKDMVLLYLYVRILSVTSKRMEPAMRK